MTIRQIAMRISVCVCVVGAAFAVQHAARSAHQPAGPKIEQEPAAAAPAKAAADPVERAIRNGNVLRDMTPAQVRRAMTGAPQTILRAATSRTISEVWIFEPVGATRTAVHFRRHRRDPRSAAKVINVSRFGE